MRINASCCVSAEIDLLVLKTMNLRRTYHDRWSDISITWNNVKCIKNNMKSGRLNQKYLLLGSTIGAPFTTVVLSWIWWAISIITSSSLVPTSRSICQMYEGQGTYLVPKIYQLDIARISPCFRHWKIQHKNMKKCVLQLEVGKRELKGQTILQNNKRNHSVSTNLDSNPGDAYGRWWFAQNCLTVDIGELKEDTANP